MGKLTFTKMQMHEIASFKSSNQFYLFMGPSWCRRKLWVFQFPGYCGEMSLSEGSCGFSITNKKQRGQITALLKFSN